MCLTLMHSVIIVAMYTSVCVCLSTGIGASKRREHHKLPIATTHKVSPVSQANFCKEHNRLSYYCITMSILSYKLAVALLLIDLMQGACHFPIFINFKIVLCDA